MASFVFGYISLGQYLALRGLMSFYSDYMACYWIQVTHFHQGTKNGPKVRHRDLNTLEIQVIGQEWAAAGLGWRERWAQCVSQVLDGRAHVIGTETKL